MMQFCKNNQMEEIYIAPKPTSPEIHFSPDKNIFLLRGISSPEDVRELYYPVIEWVNIFVNSILEQKITKYSADFPLKIQIDFDYFNSSSAKFLYDILFDLKRVSSLNIPLIVEWIYDEEDIDMLDAGSDIALLTEMEFTYKIKNM
jgi:hypothetical protein